MGRMGRLGEGPPAGLARVVAEARPGARARDAIPAGLGTVAGGRDTSVTALTRVAPAGVAEAPVAGLGRVGVGEPRLPVAPATGAAWGFET